MELPKIAGLAERVAALAEEPLGSTKIVRDLVEGELQQDLPVGVIDIPDVELNVAARGLAAVEVYNSEDDRDPDGVLAQRAGRGDDLPPQLRFTSERAWVKYRLEGRLRARGGLRLASLGFDFDPECTLVLADYRVHGREQALAAALAADAQAPRFAVRCGDILALAEGDAVALQFVGRVAAKIELRWADVLASQVGALGRVLRSAGAEPITIAAGARVTAGVSLEDEFALVFSRAPAGRLRVAVKKARNRKAVAAASIGVDVDASALAGVLGPVLEARLAAPWARVGALLDRTSLDQLTADEKKLLRRLLAKLGLEGVPDGLAALRAEASGLESTLRSALREIAENRIRVGFAYEYSRIRRDESLLQLVIPEGALARHHADLVRGRLAGLLDAARQREPGIELESYLNEQSIERKATWGVALSLGRWTLRGQDHREIRSVVQENLEGRKRVSYLGVRSYEGELVTKAAWGVDFRAEMPAFSRTPTPGLDEFDFGLCLKLSDEVLSVGEADLSARLDTGVLWGALAPARVAATRASLKHLRGSAARFDTQLRVDPVAFEKLIPAAAAATETDFARALASAMLWDDVPGLDTPGNRRELYATVWEFYLHNSADASEVQAYAANHFRTKRDTALAAREENAGDSPLTATGLVRRNPATAEAWLKWREGLQALDRALARSQPLHSQIEDAFRDLQKLWSTALGVRAAGAHLVDLVRAASLADGVHASLKIRYEKDGEKKADILGGQVAPVS
ncbi:MAG: hypothetical protein KBD01_05575 [Acidobacteria bacterium]|nr:hypothetical protein [Acidobacteriota bacterium]